MALLALGCGGSTDTNGTGGTSGTGASSGAGGGGGGTGGSGGSGGTLSWQECFGADGQQVQWALDLCTGATCQIEQHVLDCCGTVMLVGIEASKKAMFDACEAAWTATLPPCGCAPGPTQIQQPHGGTVTDPSKATVGCVNWTQSGGICMTSPAG